MSGSWRLWDKEENVPHTHMTIKCEVDKKIIYLAYVRPTTFWENVFFYESRVARKKEVDGC